MNQHRPDVQPSTPSPAPTHPDIDLPSPARPEPGAPETAPPQQQPHPPTEVPPPAPTARGRVLIFIQPG
ncbi:MAG TPA: hypothetical protein VFB32_12185 [Rudaea sp.]|jgi:hypothetical protein|nr:hypothetical protein [Rudaea sp.]